MRSVTSNFQARRLCVLCHFLSLRPDTACSLQFELLVLPATGLQTTWNSAPLWILLLSVLAGLLLLLLLCLLLWKVSYWLVLRPQRVRCHYLCESLFSFLFFSLSFSVVSLSVPVSGERWSFIGEGW